HALSFFYTDPATTEPSTLSLHDALPISFDARLRQVQRQPGVARTDGEDAESERRRELTQPDQRQQRGRRPRSPRRAAAPPLPARSEEHTSELQSLRHLVCRLLLEKKKQE